MASRTGMSAGRVATHARPAGDLDRRQRPESPLIPIDLSARGPERSGRANAGFVSVDGDVFDARHVMLGHVQANGVVRRGTERVALVEHGHVKELRDGRMGVQLGSVRVTELPSCSLAYLCKPAGEVVAFVLVDRVMIDEASAELGRGALERLAGAALALLKPWLD